MMGLKSEVWFFRSFGLSSASGELCAAVGAPHSEIVGHQQKGP